MPEPKDLMGILFIIVFIGVIIKYIFKFINWQKELEYRRQINKKQEYNTQTPEELARESEELKKQIKINHKKYYDKLFEGHEFVNKKTTSLDEFIINEYINHYDLHKLAELNNIKLEMYKGWNDLSLELMKELNTTGWNRKVTSIKQKFGELRFYAETERGDIINAYTEKSKTICEICGEPGKFYFGIWDETRCDLHKT
ncbi:hypothetical protein [Kordia sp.]|uniref:hypothetical protein n=1 Tax=Kordia sp. TaxID=1965332 RepID=UPI003B5B967D